MNERPDWKTGDTIRSATEVLAIAWDAGKLLVADALNKVDSWLADYGDTDVKD